MTCQHRNFLIWGPDVIMGFPGDSVVKNLPANARDAREASLIPEWGRYLEEEMATHSSILAWKVPWSEEPGELQSTGSQSPDTTEHTHTMSLGFVFYCYFFFFLPSFLYFFTSFSLMCRS